MTALAVVDTDVLSFLFKSSPHVAPYQKMIRGASPVISFMTLAELDSWAIRRNWGIQRRTTLERFLSHDTIYDSDRSLCQRWAEVAQLGYLLGRPIGCADAWITATALDLDCPLITKNAAGYRMIPGPSIRTASTPEGS